MKETSWSLYRTFNLGLMVKYPADHIAWGSCEIASMVRSRNGTRSFPTPQNVVQMMAKMTMSEAEKTRTFYGLFCGTGTMLLKTLNCCLRLTAQDIDLSLVKMATVNAWIYPMAGLPGAWIDRLELKSRS